MKPWTKCKIAIAACLIAQAILGLSIHYKMADYHQKMSEEIQSYNQNISDQIAIDDGCVDENDFENSGLEIETF